MKNTIIFWLLALSRLLQAQPSFDSVAMELTNIKVKRYYTNDGGTSGNGKSTSTDAILHNEKFYFKVTKEVKSDSILVLSLTPRFGNGGTLTIKYGSTGEILFFDFFIVGSDGLPAHTEYSCKNIGSLFGPDSIKLFKLDSADLIAE